MKTWYDKRAKSRYFNVGNQVLVFFPTPHAHQPLQARYVLWSVYTSLQRKLMKLILLLIPQIDASVRDYVTSTC